MGQICSDKFSFLFSFIFDTVFYENKFLGSCCEHGALVPDSLRIVGWKSISFTFLKKFEDALLDVV